MTSKKAASFAFMMALVGVTFTAQAQILTVNNPGFETPVLPPGTYTGYSSPEGDSMGGWTPAVIGGTQESGVQNISTNGYTNPSGDNDAFNDTATPFYEGVSLGSSPFTIEAGTYTLDVDMLARSDASVGGTIGLYTLNGSNLGTELGFKVVAGSDLTVGTFVNEELVVTIGPSDASIGQQLAIGLAGNVTAGGGVNADFDSVRLDFDAIPEAPTWAMLLGGGLLLAAVSRRFGLRASR